MGRKFMVLVKEALLVAFYAVQGVGNLILGLFFIVGGPGGGGFAMEIMIRAFLVFSSSLSLFTALALYLRRESLIRLLGDVSSLLFGAFYAWIVLGITWSIVFQAQQIAAQNYKLAAALFLSILIVVLNLISALLLHRRAETKLD